MRDADRHWLKQIVLSPVASQDLSNSSRATIFVLGSRSTLARFQISTSLGSNSSFLPSSFAVCLPLFFGASNPQSVGYRGGGRWRANRRTQEDFLSSRIHRPRASSTPVFSLSSGYYSSGSFDCYSAARAPRNLGGHRRRNYRSTPLCPWQWLLDVMQGGSECLSPDRPRGRRS